jgi:hypothetical protein
MKTEQELESEILAQVRHLRWAASQGYTVPITDEEPIVTKARPIYYCWPERDPLRYIHCHDCYPDNPQKFKRDGTKLPNY